LSATHLSLSTITRFRTAESIASSAVDRRGVR
jgi:hypothetical protein